MDSVFAEYPRFTVEGQYRKLIENGNAFYRRMAYGKELVMPGEQVRVYDDNGKFYGIFEFRQEEDRFFPVKMFMENGC